MEAKQESHKLIFEKEGVYLHTNAKRSNQDTTIPGFIRIVERDGEPALEWSPLEEDGRNAPAVFYTKKNTELISVMFYTSVPLQWRRGHWSSFSLPLSELYCLRRARFSLGKNFLVLTTRGGDPLPPLHFHRGGTRELLLSMQRYIRLAPSPLDGRLFLAYPHDSGALSQSFDELHLFDDTSADLVSRFIQDPYATTFGGFSKVTNFFRGALRPPESPLGNRSPQAGHGPHPSDEEPGFELITCGAELGPRPVVERGEPLNDFDQFLDSEGRVTDPQRVKELVFRGGIVPSQRKEVWKFLLGFYPWNSTTKEREDILRVKTDEYFRMKVQWKSVSEEQEMRNSLFRGHRSLIGYVQGMSDLLAPLLFVTQNEVESFWCLTGFMELVHINELTMKLNLRVLVCDAEAIYLQLAHCKELPVKVQEVLGLYVPSKSAEENPHSVTRETDTLLSQSEVRGATACQSDNGQTPQCPPPTYP
ncbi:TBC1 domain family member 17 [Triplophysa tibetana]|uniref:TBC1 domain family member 17 n=1 Tax=Triplophysa tibetana TaxID=1572043 RepID=A0A5A9N9M6_9TELE|nr:TBC1 domain family member 17 [Triplophysa tibetana]